MNSDISQHELKAKFYYLLASVSSGNLLKLSAPVFLMCKIGIIKVLP